MKKYNVHCFAVVRVTIKDVEANSPAEAAQKIDEQTDFNDIFDNMGENIEFAEEVNEFCVDTVGDDTYKNTVWLNNEYQQRKRKQIMNTNNESESK